MTLGVAQWESLSYAQNLIEIGRGPLQEPFVFETFDVGEIAQRRAAAAAQAFRSLTARWMSQAE